MPTLVDYFASPAWWLTAVVFAIGLNIVAAYLKAKMDRRLDRRSAKRRAQVEALKKRDDALVTELRAGTEDESRVQYADISIRLASIQSLVLALALFGMSVATLLALVIIPARPALRIVGGVVAALAGIASIASSELPSKQTIGRHDFCRF